MLNITAAELTALNAHFHDEIHDGFLDDVNTVKAALSEGENLPAQEACWAVSGVLHRSLERLENGLEDDRREEYATLNALAEKLTNFEELMYQMAVWE